MEYTDKNIAEMMDIYGNLVKYDNLLSSSEEDIDRIICSAISLKHYIERLRGVVPEEIREGLSSGNSFHLKSLESKIKAVMDSSFEQFQ